jgi:hypothetical protein
MQRSKGNLDENESRGSKSEAIAVRLTEGDAANYFQFRQEENNQIGRSDLELVEA